MGDENGQREQMPRKWREKVGGRRTTVKDRRRWRLMIKNAVREK